MTEKDDSDDPIQIDMVLELPRILEGPLVLSDGSTLSVGDRVEHATLGTGTIIRLFEYSELGPGVFVDFGNEVEDMIGVGFVKKVVSP